MKALLLLNLLLLQVAIADVRYKPDNKSVASKHAVFTSIEKLCTLSFTLIYSDAQASLSLSDYKHCELTEARYGRALKQVLAKAKSVLPLVKISYLIIGEGHPHPLSFGAIERIAKVSVSDPGFKKIQKEGERSITLNTVFQNIIKETKPFEQFIQLHKEAGLPLSYERAEKVLRDKNSKGERIISGAGLIIFKVI